MPAPEGTKMNFDPVNYCQTATELKPPKFFTEKQFLNYWEELHPAGKDLDDIHAQGANTIRYLFKAAREKKEMEGRKRKALEQVEHGLGTTNRIIKDLTLTTIRKLLSPQSSQQGEGTTPE
jgi:hypothetical protein